MSNKLAQEKSPYLLQHKDNPVDWYPWSDEAFEKAKKEQKPIFLSIGYATCHWCHVMEHESFEDSEIASMMNQAFVNIKVDREERPEPAALFSEEPRLRDAARIQGGERNPRLVVEAAVHLLDRHHVAHLRIFVGLGAEEGLAVGHLRTRSGLEAGQVAQIGSRIH